MEEIFLGRNFLREKFSFPTFSRCLVRDGRVENGVCIPHLTEGGRAGKEQTFISTLSWKCRVFLNYFTEGLEGSSGFAQCLWSPRLWFLMERDPLLG